MLTEKQLNELLNKAKQSPDISTVALAEKIVAEARKTPQKQPIVLMMFQGNVFAKMFFLAFVALAGFSAGYTENKTLSRQSVKNDAAVTANYEASEAYDLLWGNTVYIEDLQG